jgi:hypothetical protein
MIAPVRKRRPEASAQAWHAGFLAMVPVIRQYAMGAFGHLNPEARQDLVQETICNAMLAYLRLFQRGRITLAYPTVLAKYGIAQVKDGRRVGAKLNVLDISSRYCQQKKNITVERLDEYDATSDEWQEILIEDRHAGPFDIVRTKLDFAAWLRSLPTKLRRIAKSLAGGESTTGVAQKFGLTAGRISQIRRELLVSWRRFIGEDPVAA